MSLGKAGGGEHLPKERRRDAGLEAIIGNISPAMSSRELPKVDKPAKGLQPNPCTTNDDMEAAMLTLVEGILREEH